jgi:hypothetical protein
MIVTLCTSLPYSINQGTKEAAPGAPQFNSLAMICLSLNVLEFYIGVRLSCHISVFHSCLYTFHIYFLKVLLYSWKVTKDSQVAGIRATRLKISPSDFWLLATLRSQVRVLCAYLLFCSCKWSNFLISLSSSAVVRSDYRNCERASYYGGLNRYLQTSLGSSYVFYHIMHKVWTENFGLVSQAG